MSAASKCEGPHGNGCVCRYMFVQACEFVLLSYAAYRKAVSVRPMHPARLRKVSLCNAPMSCTLVMSRQW